MASIDSFKKYTVNKSTPIPLYFQFKNILIEMMKDDYRVKLKQEFWEKMSYFSFIISYIGVKYDLFILTGEERGFELENG